MKWRFFLILVLAIIGCETIETKNDIRLDVEKVVEVIIPLSWKVENLNGSDFTRYSISTEDGATFYLEYGIHCSALTEERPEFIIDSSYYEILKSSPNYSPNRYIYEPKTDCKDYDLYRKHNIGFETISGRYCKRVFPVNKGAGMTGVHFYKLKNNSDDIESLRMNIYGYNLTEIQKDEFESVIDNLKWKVSCDSCSDLCDR